MRAAIDPRCPEGWPRKRRAQKVPQVPSGQLALTFRNPAPATDADIVKRYLLGILPPGTPPNFQRIGDVRSRRMGRRRVFWAELTMVDGLTATVEVDQWTHGGIQWGGHSYPRWEGPALYFDDGEWRRDDEPLTSSAGAPAWRQDGDGN